MSKRLGNRIVGLSMGCLSFGVLSWPVERRLEGRSARPPSSWRTPARQPSPTQYWRLAGLPSRSPERSGGRRLVESAGNAPAWACLQGRCIACLPRPHVKSEVRNPKSETSSKLEVRITGSHGLTAPAPRRAVEHAYRFGFRDWDFGIPSNFGLRTSDFELAGRLGAAPSRLGFGDPAARAGARPKGGAAAGNRTRVVAVRKDLRGGEPFSC